MNDSTPTNGWDQWQRLVLYRLDTIGASIKAIQQELSTLDRRVTVIEVKAMVVGAVAGLVASGLVTWLVNSI